MRQPLGFSREFFRHFASHRRIYDLTVGRTSGLTIVRHIPRMLDRLIPDDRLRRSQARRGSKSLEIADQFTSGARWTLMILSISSGSRLAAEDTIDEFRRLAFQGLDASFDLVKRPS